MTASVVSQGGIHEEDEEEKEKEEEEDGISGV